MSESGGDLEQPAGVSARGVVAANGGEASGEQALSYEQAAAASLDCRERRPRELRNLAQALAGHDPQRTLERGYVLASTPQGRPVTTAAQARRAPELELRFADATLGVRLP